MTEEEQEKQDHEKNVDLSSGEIGYLWETYQYESLASCGIQYFLSNVDDQQIQILLEEALGLSETRLSQITDILTKENYPIPQGFTDDDVNLNAPRLFSDKLYIEYLLHTLQMELVFYSSAMLGVAKLNIQTFYQQVIEDTMKLEMKTKELMKKKGLLIRDPIVPTPKKVEFVEKNSFLAGWFGNKRPLLAMEIALLAYNAKRNTLGHAVITAFSQVAQSKEVSRFFSQGREIAQNHIEVFTNVLHNDDLGNASMLLTAEITDSTEAPFSDKLMMNFITMLIASSLGEYGSAMSMSPRRDLGLMYTRLMAKIAQYSNEGAELLIKNGWMEQPPMAADRQTLIQKENK